MTQAKKMTYREAVRAALREALAKDSRVFLMGEDVGRYGIDSMDFLNFAIGLCKELGVEVPEADYPKVASLDGCVEYVMEKYAR